MAQSSGAQSQRFLIGKEGRDAVVSALSAENPRDVLQRFQTVHSLEPGLGSTCQPAIKLLELLGTSRCEVNSGLLQALSAALSTRTESMPEEQVSQLIQISYPYVAFDELRPTVFDAMKRHAAIPPRVLEHLLSDAYLKTHRPDILTSLAPLQVRQQLWARDPSGAFADMIQQLDASYHAAAPDLFQDLFIEIALSLRQSLLALQPPETTETAAPAPPAPAAPEYLTASAEPVQATQLRLGATLDWETQKAAADRTLATLPAMLSRSAIQRRKMGITGNCVQQLLTNVGTSVSLYSAAIDWCRQQGALSADLRHDLLMAAHDSDRRALCEADPIYRAAWILDACLSDDQFDSRRLKELDSLLTNSLSAQPVKTHLTQITVSKKRHTLDTEDVASSSGASGMRLRSRSLRGTMSSSKEHYDSHSGASEDDEDSFELGMDWMDVSDDEDRPDDLEFRVRPSKRRKIDVVVEPEASLAAPQELPIFSDLCRLVQESQAQNMICFHIARRIRDLVASSRNQAIKDYQLHRLLSLVAFPSQVTPRDAQKIISTIFTMHDGVCEYSMLRDFSESLFLRIYLWCCLDALLQQSTVLLTSLSSCLQAAGFRTAVQKQFLKELSWQKIFTVCAFALPRTHPCYVPSIAFLDQMFLSEEAGSTNFAALKVGVALATLVSPSESIESYANKYSLTSDAQQEIESILLSFRYKQSTAIQ